MCRIRRDKNTNTKYTNTTYDELPEIPKTLYIFEHQGFAQLYHTFKDCSVSQPKGFSGRLFLISHIPCFGLSTAILRRDFLMLKNSNLSGDTNMPDSTGKYFIIIVINTNEKTRKEIPFIIIYTKTNEKKTCTKLDRPQSLFDLCRKKKD